uniref:Peptidyl-tRNA hydrolase ICT1, mitochondrial isoform X2 n=1 Tax=Elaeis guineensis var. tenera TaxID=51953 RepID=A0A6I9QCH9_ELAGV|nr:peptidyl-tRNA hydrolase ICT1, mitochondrial isoform X2 [Elaeis guineensis]
MAGIRSNLLLRELCHVSPFLRPSRTIPAILIRVHVGIGDIRCAASQSGDGDKKVSARLSMMQQILQDAEERAVSASSESALKITLMNTKVDMRFNVSQAHWLSERVRERILQMEKNRINKDGEIVISSTRTRTQKGNIEDALEKLQAIIDAASYVPPPPSEEQKKKIEKLAAIGEQKRMQNKKAISQRKAFRRNKESWD